ncbi:TPA: stress response small protein YobI, partial [Escherichia coli]|nr:stress response small protein YobI [Escherichia coli]HBB5791492.1 stress response small protein YobI [Escherichia coli]HCD4689948.1 stress response small protein YobI [Escherichia coli]HCD6565072.1 stress response small protein YobI [Escherichia coli]HCD7299577.1 stress response small protein YobI [Escherichia coli]
MYIFITHFFAEYVI